MLHIFVSGVREEFLANFFFNLQREKCEKREKQIMNSLSWRQNLHNFGSSRQKLRQIAFFVTGDLEVYFREQKRQSSARLVRSN